MPPTRRFTALLFLVLAAAPASASHPAGYVAFSLREAQRRAKSADSRTQELGDLAGISRIAGMVYDESGGDVILVGKRVRGLPAARLDDLVVALRTLLIHDQWPRVSIEPTETTAQTGLLAVELSDGIARTPFGMAFRNSDVTLKRYALGFLQEVPPVSSYKSLCVETIQNEFATTRSPVIGVRWLQPDDVKDFHGQPVNSQEAFHARFWFTPSEPLLFGAREGVFSIKRLRLRVTVEQVTAAGEKTEGDATSGPMRTAAATFAGKFTEEFWRLADAHADLKRLKTLYDMVAIADGVRRLEAGSLLSYFLHEYRVTAENTDDPYQLDRLQALVERSDGTQQLIQLAGGIELRTEIKWLNDGDFTPLKKIVLDARRDSTDLSWPLPLEGWNMPNGEGVPMEEALKTVSRGEAPAGFSLTVQSIVLGSAKQPSQGGAGPGFQGFSRVTLVPHTVNLLPPRTQYLASFSPGGADVGGVEMSIEPVPERVKEGDLEDLRKSILQQRPSAGTRSWGVSGPKAGDR